MGKDKPKDGLVKAMSLKDWGTCEAAMAGILAANIANFHKALCEGMGGKYIEEVAVYASQTYAEYLMERAKQIEFASAPVMPNANAEVN